MVEEPLQSEPQGKPTWWSMTIMICIEFSIIFWAPAPQRPVSAKFPATSSRGKTRHSCVGWVWSTPSAWQLNKIWGTSLGLFGCGTQQLMSNSISDVFLPVLEGRTGVQSGEGFDGIVEVSVALVERHSEVQFLWTHINNKYYHKTTLSSTSASHSRFTYHISLLCIIYPTVWQLLLFDFCWW